MSGKTRGAAVTAYPETLLMWLRERCEDARSMADEYEEQDGPDDYETVLWRGREEAFREVIQHISFGGL